MPSQLHTRLQRPRGVKRLLSGHKVHYWKTWVFPKPIPAGTCLFRAFADLEKCKDHSPLLDSSRTACTTRDHLAVCRPVTSLGFPTDSLCGQMLSQKLCLADLEMFPGRFYDSLSFVLLIVEVVPTSGALHWISRDHGPGGAL